LTAGEAFMGCLYLEGAEDSFSVDASDLIFLQALASQLAVASDRAQLAEQERLRQERERRRLEAQLDELRRALQEAKLVYRSQEMEMALGVARRVAPTDATVLIMGESGTGKELFARTIHAVSPRRKKPLVVVDCGAIPTSLIDSELFGHEKGAYTGAGQRKIGRLAEADGGTVLLDEIGELPLEVQSKLLRFVQDKQLTPVGDTRSRTVDARLIAATNCDLAAEVAAGRFREDLYHRLNVVRLLIPPLRERPDDILYLADHFLEIYALLYGKNVRQLTPEAEALMVQYTWPGNVRELQNRVMQAVILCEDEELGVAELALPTLAEAPPPRTVGATAPAAMPLLASGPRPARTDALSGGPGQGAGGASHGTRDTHRLWEIVRAALARQIEAALGDGGGRAVPLGRWLSDDLVLEASAAAGGRLRRGASVVGIAETTFRRRVRRAAEQAATGLAPRPASWQEVRDALAALVRAPGVRGVNLLERTQQVFFEEVVARAPGDTRLHAALLGVTAATYRRRAARLAPLITTS
jgi:DNA-binding NtrC family response regulator